MLLPIDPAWKCCETCDHWSGNRNLAPTGFVAYTVTQNRSQLCRIPNRTEAKEASTCATYEKWHELTRCNTVDQVA
jgi:hypothetical protein